jgi:ABC-type multidrug transport system permease subunit
MNLAWWSEHPSELPLLLLTAVVTHLLTSFSLKLTNALYGLFRRLLARPI